MTAQTLHFTGRARLAALVLLDDTPLDALRGSEHRYTHPATEQTGEVTDDGNLLTVTVPDITLGRFSSGERQLWTFLASLSGTGVVNLWSLAMAIDHSSQLAVWRAFGEFVGVPSTWEVQPS